MNFNQMQELARERQERGSRERIAIAPAARAQPPVRSAARSGAAIIAIGHRIAAEPQPSWLGPDEGRASPRPEEFLPWPYSPMS